MLSFNFSEIEVINLRGLDMQISTGSSGISNFLTKLYKGIKHVWLAKLHLWSICKGKHPSEIYQSFSVAAPVYQAWNDVEEVGFNTVDYGYIYMLNKYKYVSNVWGIQSIWNHEFIFWVVVQPLSSRGSCCSKHIVVLASRSCAVELNKRWLRHLRVALHSAVYMTSLFLLWPTP